MRRITTLLAAATVVVIGLNSLPARADADDWGNRQGRQHERHERASPKHENREHEGREGAWRRHEWREHHGWYPSYYNYSSYAPPAYYVPPPVYYPPGVTVGFGFR